jgi:teichuronic acid biosynthesis glycosyltransferase TuaC
MKVLWLTSAYPWSGDPYGGIFFQTQAQALSRLGVGIAVEVPVPWIPEVVARVSPRHAHQRSAPRQQVDEETHIQRVPYFGHRFQEFLGWPHLGIARKTLKNLSFKPDLIHGHYAYPTGLAAVEVARQLGIPSVITLHGSDVNVSATRSKLGARRFQVALSGADRVLCVSQALCERTRLLTGLSASYLPIGINLRRFPSTLNRSEARAALQLPSEKPIILFIGLLHPSKGVLLALEALAHPSLAGMLGVFVGAGPLGPVISTRANCLWHNSVPNTLIPDYLAAADLLILPSYAEGLPTVLVEAGASGTPVIATEVGGIPELLKDDRGSLIAPGSVESLRMSILETLATPEAAQRRARHLRERVLDAFDADRNAQRLLHIYQELLFKGNSTPR